MMRPKMNSFLALGFLFFFVDLLFPARALAECYGCAIQPNGVMYCARKTSGAQDCLTKVSSTENWCKTFDSCGGSNPREPENIVQASPCGSGPRWVLTSADAPQQKRTVLQLLVADARQLAGGGSAQ